MSLNAVSKHIRVLEAAHLVYRRREGRQHFLSFNPIPLADAAMWMETQRAVWSARLNALDAMLQAEDRRTASALHRKGPRR